MGNKFSKDSLLEVFSRSKPMPDTPSEDLTQILTRRFTLFPNLPYEIQQLVWYYAVENRQRRNISIKLSDRSGDRRFWGRKVFQHSLETFDTPPLLHAQLVWYYAVENRPQRNISIKLSSRSGDRRFWSRKVSQHSLETFDTPPLLHACHNSRKEALKYYELSFEQNLKHPVYIDYKKDEVTMECKRHWTKWNHLQNFIFEPSEFVKFDELKKIVGKRGRTVSLRHRLDDSLKFEARYRRRKQRGQLRT